MAKKASKAKVLELVHSKPKDGGTKDVGPKTGGPKDGGTKSARLGSSRGIESMFRNSYRAQLDMIALAATKANIMISLNGLLVSVLLVSGAYFLGSEPMLIIPFLSFLLTCTVAIVFAALAARPGINREDNSLEDFRTDRAHLLVFEQFAKLSKEDYLDAMLEMVRDNDRIYKNMIFHIHELGLMADRKFARLYISYSAFMIGLVVSVLLLFGVVANHVIVAG